MRGAERHLDVAQECIEEASEKEFMTVDTPLDCWALGALAFWILSGENPFKSSNIYTTMDRIVEGRWRMGEEFAWVSRGAKEVVSCLLTQNPRDRMDAESCLQHPWIQGSGAKEEELHTAKTRFRRYQAVQRFKWAIRSVTATNRMANARFTVSGVHVVSAREAPLTDYPRDLVTDNERTTEDSRVGENEAIHANGAKAIRGFNLRRRLRRAILTALATNRLQRLQLGGDATARD